MDAGCRGIVPLFRNYFSVRIAGPFRFYYTPFFRGRKVFPGIEKNTVANAALFWYTVEVQWRRRDLFAVFSGLSRILARAGRSVGLLLPRPVDVSVLGGRDAAERKASPLGRGLS